MVSEETKQLINAMAREELVEEVARANRSRFQGDSFAYLKARLDNLDQHAAAQDQENVLAIAREANRISTESNQIASESNTLSETANTIAKDAANTASQAYRMSIFSVIVALVATLIALLPQCAGKP